MATTKERTISKVKTSDGRYGTPVTTTLSAVYEKLRSGDNEERVKKIARNVTVAVINGSDTGVGADTLPYLLFGATFGKGGLDDVRTKTGLVLLSIACPEGLSRIEALKLHVAQLPYTLLTFTGSSQKTLKVVVVCRYGDGFEPQTTDEYAQLLIDGHQTAARLYQALADCEVQDDSRGLLAGCRMSNDPQAFQQGVPFRVRQQGIPGKTGKQRVGAGGGRTLQAQGQFPQHRQFIPRPRLQHIPQSRAAVGDRALHAKQRALPGVQHFFPPGQPPGRPQAQRHAGGRRHQGHCAAQGNPSPS